MNKGIFQGTFPMDMGLFECFDYAKEYGYGGIELVLEASDGLPFDLVEGQDDILGLARSVGAGAVRPDSLTIDADDASIVRVKQAASQRGLVIHSVLCILQFMFPLTSGNDRIRETAVEIAERLIHVARLTGAETVLLIPGIVTPTVSYHEAYQRARDIIGTLVKKAEANGVMLAVENVWNRFLLSPLEMRDFIDSFHSDHIQAYFDVGNILSYGYPEQWISILDHRIKGVHIKDFLLSIGNIRGFTYPFQGDVDWVAVMKALRETGYDGYLTIEVPPYRSFSLETVRQGAEALNHLLALT